MARARFGPRCERDAELGSDEAAVHRSEETMLEVSFSHNARDGRMVGVQGHPGG